MISRFKKRCVIVWIHRGGSFCLMVPMYGVPGLHYKFHIRTIMNGYDLVLYGCMYEWISRAICGAFSSHDCLVLTILRFGTLVIMFAKRLVILWPIKYYPLLIIAWNSFCCAQVLLWHYGTNYSMVSASDPKSCLASPIAFLYISLNKGCHYHDKIAYK